MDKLLEEQFEDINDHVHEIIKEQKMHLRKIKYHKAEADKLKEALDIYMEGIEEIKNMPQLRTDKKLGKFIVNESTLEDYVTAVNVMRVNYDPNSLKNRHSEFTPNPIEQLASFNKRVELHKKLFKEAGVPYHDSPKANKDSTELYKLIEKEIEQKDRIDIPPPPPAPKDQMNTATVIKDQMGRPRKVECPNVNTLKQKEEES